LLCFELRRIRPAAGFLGFRLLGERGCGEEEDRKSGGDGGDSAMRWPVLVPICAVIVSSAAVWGAEPSGTATAVGAHPPLESRNWPFAGRATVRVEPASVAWGETFQLDCEVKCSGSATLYNPFLAEEHRLPAQIIISSMDGKVRRELLRRTDAAPANHPATTWLSTWGVSLGRRFTIRVGVTAEGADDSGIRTIDLPPGEYFVQAIYSYWICPARVWHLPLERRPADAKPEEPQPVGGLSAAQMERPLLVSEPVKVVVTSPSVPREQQQKPQPDAFPLRCELRPDSTQVVVGRPAKIEFRFTNESDQTLEVFEPLHALGKGPWRAAILAVLDADGNVIGDLFYRMAGKANRPTTTSWVWMPPGAFVATPYQFRAGILEGTRHFHAGNPLPPGKYFLELRIHDHALSGRPWDMGRIERLELAAILERLGRSLPAGEAQEDPVKDVPEGPTLNEWLWSLPGREVSRSQRVTLELLPRTGD
jgi:hypothetical protein